MARPATPLQKKYGKLTVLSESVIDSRRVAQVQCTCGVIKGVLADALRSGRARSCGSLVCRVNKSKVKRDPSYKPRGPAAMSMRQLRYWYPRVEAEKVTSADVAAKLELSYNTVYSLFRNVRKAGGLERYIKTIKGE